MVVENGISHNDNVLELTAAAHPRRATASSQGVARSILLCVALGTVAAMVYLVVHTALFFLSESYIAWRVLVAAAAFWAVAGAAAGAVLGVVCAIVSVAFKRAVCLPIASGVLCAAVYAAGAVNMRSHAGPRDLLAASVFLNPWMVAAASIAFAAIVTLVCLRSRRPVAESAFAAAGGALCGVFAFLCGRYGAYVLMVGPLLVLSLCEAAHLRVAARAGRLVKSGVLVALATAFLVMAFRHGRLPAGAVDDHFPPDPGQVALLAGKPNVLLITLDTTRADHMSVCGYKHPTTPNLEKLAADSRFFPYGESVDSWTLPAHASMFTGLYPRQHGARAAGEGSDRLPGGPVSALSPSQVTMATLLSLKGYNTAAFASNFAWLSRKLGLQQGFSYYHDMPRFLLSGPGEKRLYEWAAKAVDRLLGLNGKFTLSYHSGDSVTGFAADWLRENGGSPFFLFLNYMDPHEPYAPPPGFDRLHQGVAFNHRITDEAVWTGIYEKYVSTGEGLDPVTLQQVINQYDGEIAYADHWVGRLIDTLKADGLYDDTLIIVTADHGEFLGEHGLLNHSMAVYEGGVRTPVIVKYPRSAHAGEVISSRVSVVDIYATVFDVLKLPTPPVAAQPLGTSTRPVVIDSYRNENIIARYGARFDRGLTAIYDGDWKLVRSSRGPLQLFNLKSNPEESLDLSASEPEVVARLDKRLSQWHADTPVFVPGKNDDNVSADLMDRLRALGYIGGAAAR